MDISVGDRLIHCTSPYVTWLGVRRNGLCLEKILIEEPQIVLNGLVEIPLLLMVLVEVLLDVVGTKWWSEAGIIGWSARPIICISAFRPHKHGTEATGNCRYSSSQCAYYKMPTEHYLIRFLEFGRALWDFYAFRDAGRSCFREGWKTEVGSSDLERSVLKTHLRLHRERGWGQEMNGGEVNEKWAT